MNLYMLADQRTAALAQYEQCARILEAELGVEPDEETTALYQQIRDGMAQGDKRIEMALARSPALSPEPPQNLSVATTSFLGREEELAHIGRWLGEADGRLLTITGPGGMGKSRLALKAARGQVGQFADGVWLVSLVAQVDLVGLVTAVADAIGLTLSGRADPATQLLNHLRSQEMLLVLDNLEHLISADLLDFLTQLTDQSPDLRLIVTSRERLRLQAESLLDLQGLAFPPEQQPATSADLHASSADYPAVQLFRNRAERVQAEFSLAAQEAAIVQLCQLVGGLPLALELAATWTRVLSVAEMTAEIQRGLDRLTTTLHDVPPRHRSLHAVIATSWEMLAADEQSLFRRLAVFRGGFSRGAAEVVAGATPTRLLSLVDRSFLRLDSDQRFRRHPLLLQFAQEQLAAQPEELAQAATRHAHFFADFVQARERPLLSADASQALAAIGADLENVRAAWQWGLAQIDEALLEQMVTGVGRFFSDRSRYQEGIALFTESASRLRSPATAGGDRPILAQVLGELGYFLHQNGCYAEAEAAFREADELAGKLQLVPLHIACLRGLGIIANSQGNWAEAQRCLLEAYRLCADDCAVDVKLPVLNALGTLYTNLAEFEQAQAYFDEAMAFAQSLGHQLRIAILHSNIGIIANRQKKYEEAIRQWRLAEVGFAASNHDMGLANIIFNIAMALHGLQRYEEALETIRRAYAIHEKLGQQQSMAAGSGVMGMIYHKLGRRAAARDHLYDCLRQAQALGMSGIAVSGLAELAELELSGGNLQQAALLLAFISQHPATSGTTQANTQKLLDDLAAELSPALIAKAQTAAQAHTLDSLIKQLIE